jgi:CubicO group peptidase (beta-lactamase class C family)
VVSPEGKTITAVDPGQATGLSRRGFLAGVSVTGASLAMSPVVAQGRPTNVTNEFGTRVKAPEAAEIERFLDEQIPAQLEEHDIAGATVAVVTGSGPTVAKGYGYADVEAETPVRADETPFNIASVSKAVTGTVVMRAVESGLVDLDTDVNEYLDTFSLPDTYSEPITLEHLGTHTAGFAPQLLGEFDLESAEFPPLVEVVGDDPPARVRPPGEIATYSNYGFALAGHLVATAAGTTYADYARSELLDPLGMTRSSFQVPRPEGLRDARSKAYAPDDEGFREITPMISDRTPAGAMVATATDMARFLRFHLQGGRIDGEQFLSPGTVRAMHAERFSNHPAIDSVGFGFVEHTKGDARFVGAPGDGDAFHTALALFPDRELGVFIAYNTRGSGAARDEFMDAFMQQFAPPGEPEAIEPDGPPARADDLVGSYRHTRFVGQSPEKVLGAAYTLQVRVDDGYLTTGPEIPGPSERWVEVEPLVFRKVGDHSRLAFREKDGEIIYAFRSATFGLERVPLHERTVTHLGVTAVFLLAFLGGLFGWTGQRLWRWRNGLQQSAGKPRSLRVLAGLTGVSLLSSILGGVILIATSSTVSILTGLPTWYQLLLGLPSIGALGAVAMLGGTVQAWRKEYWSRLARAHYAVLATASLAFVWVLSFWQLLWTPF